MVKNKYQQELWFVDYCGNCKDLDVMSSNDIPCHHSWYCWHDNGEVQQLEFELGKLKESKHWNGRLTAQEFEKLQQLKQKKFELVKRKLREYRRNERNNRR